jgi:hypothetical protein
VTDYKKYALGQVENFLYDAMSANATPQEIYDVIKGVVEDNYIVYTKSADQAKELLDLLNGSQKHSKEYYDYDRNRSVVKTCDKDDVGLQYTDEELNAMCDSVTSAKQGKVRTLTHQEAIDAGWSLSDEGIWMSPQKKDKVTKWIIPVDDDYNITFPEDLLEQTGWKEGDTLQWIDQGDGSFKMIKKDN